MLSVDVLNGDAAHKAWGRQEAGGRAGFLNNLQQSAAVGSPAHYFNVCHPKDNMRAGEAKKAREKYATAVDLARQRASSARAAACGEVASSGRRTEQALSLIHI